MRYIGPVTTFFPLDTRNFMQLITHGILGMKIEGKAVVKNFAPIYLKLGNHSLYHPILAKKNRISAKKKKYTRNWCRDRSS